MTQQRPSSTSLNPESTTQSPSSVTKTDPGVSLFEGEQPAPESSPDTCFQACYIRYTVEDLDFWNEEDRTLQLSKLTLHRQVKPRYPTASSHVKYLTPEGICSALQTLLRSGQGTHFCNELANDMCGGELIVRSNHKVSIDDENRWVLDGMLSGSIELREDRVLPGTENMIREVVIKPPFDCSVLSAAKERWKQPEDTKKKSTLRPSIGKLFRRLSSSSAGSSRS